MLDIRLIRDNPDEIKARLASRGTEYSEQIDAILACDTARRAAETRLQQLQSERKRLSKAIGQMKAKGEDTADIEAQVKSFGEEMESLNRETAELDAKQRDLLLNLPNLPHPEVPVGNDPSANPLIREWGAKRETHGQDHVDIATRLGLLDFERAAKISGSGFACFTGAGARLERALIQFMLDLHTCEHQYLEVSPPFLVRRDCMIGTGQLPKFEDDMYGVEENSLFLAPTAEVPITNLHREEILPAETLPIRYVAYTPCFRREAGSTGRDTRGIIRMHQFDKVELVRITSAEDSHAHLEQLTREAEKVLQLLGLHYRVIELCSGDIGFSAAKTYDIEVWAPGRNAYLEVSSCTNFEDYQARRMALRYKGADGKNRFCHTLNGSGTALARLFVALLETHLQPDGSVRLPEPLHRYFGSNEIRA